MLIRYISYTEDKGKFDLNFDLNFCLKLEVKVKIPKFLKLKLKKIGG